MIKSVLLDCSVWSKARSIALISAGKKEHCQEVDIYMYL